MTSMQDFKLNTDVQYMAALAHLNGEGDRFDKMCYTYNVIIEQDNAKDFEAGWG